MATSSSLVTPHWLKDRQGAEKGRNPREEFKLDRIPGSRFFDVDKISDQNTDLPHMLPAEEAFAAAADALGIDRDTQVVIYDRSGIFSAPRVWWTFRAFGHDRVAVLDGGYPAWKAGGHPLDSDPVDDGAVDGAAQAAANPPASTKYPAKLQEGLVRSLQQVRSNIDSREETVIDARGAGRFAGKEAEPRAGVRSGHIPNSLNVPFTQVLEGGKFKDNGELAKVFASAGVNIKAPIVASCGTGVTASVLALALHQVSPASQVSVYDGSWTEWGGSEDTPLATSSD
ncbi:rhodanese domain-containing protein [Coccomyxa subellipsoidea C-169]|uniref:Sulfurtransferase n=1 Tax=Coccomyxa subellipsoidea (strain C-169) TaxID=574566 RepID=I0YKJ1_COCSC|nr:rhodanese domain-containing protein [Coccomyxa subellipsoidea C-169]EIE18910.1 rhodanese domain-containing protein [Coccomyxa subellipsoidea C-169]|eukprot:XP_005643454.1 rhodanese domain-containing protein [Coccomyxa subellipsoidea C-169]